VWREPNSEPIASQASLRNLTFSSGFIFAACWVIPMMRQRPERQSSCGV
jgi:hypothetical protein